MFVSEASATTEILVRLPKNLVSELIIMVKQENGNRSDFIHQATKLYLCERKKRHIRESYETWIYGDGKDKFKYCFRGFS